MADGGRIRDLEQVLADKIRTINGQNDKIEQLGRKSMLDEDDIRTLHEEIEKERRKSQLDEIRLKKMETILAEKMQTIEDGKNRYSSLESEIRILKD